MKLKSNTRILASNLTKRNLLNSVTRDFIKVIYFLYYVRISYFFPTFDALFRDLGIAGKFIIMGIKYVEDIHQKFSL